MKNSRFDYLFKVDSDFLEDFPKEAQDWKIEKEEDKEKKEEKE